MIPNSLTVMTMTAALILTACGQSERETMPAASDSPASTPAATMPEMADPDPDLATVLASDSRSAEDKARDAGRKPVQVLEYLGIEPGMDVIDLMAAGGWYSEVLSLAVGDDGTVTAQNPPWLLAFREGAMGKELEARIGDRLENVEKMDASWEELDEENEQYDAAVSALNFHDAYYLESPEAAERMMSAVYGALVPGGVFGIIDHAGNPDGDNKSLHRIDKALAIEIAENAGFVVEGDSSLLANPGDDHTEGVFTEGLRGKTDRFLLKLRKPAA
jgi:predicted methyltransferase